MGGGIEIKTKVSEIVVGSNFIKFSIDGIVSAVSTRMAVEEVCCMYDLVSDAFAVEVIGNDVYMYDKNKIVMSGDDWLPLGSSESSFSKFVKDYISNHDNSGGVLPEPTKIEPAMNFVIDMVHNIEELAELQKELTKWVRGKLRKDKLINELNDVYIAIENIEKWIDKL
jgi:hypothetical protein